MEKSGVILKKSLGLSKFDYVKIGRIQLSTYKILFVWYDSRRPDFPLTTRRILRAPFVAMLYSGLDLEHGKKKVHAFTPPVPIETYSGTIRTALVFAIDLNGKYLINPKAFTKQNEEIKISVHFPKEYVKEAYTLPDFKKNAISDRNKIFFKIRQDMGNTGSYLTQTIWNEKADYLVIQFKTKPTYINRKWNPYFNGIQKVVKILTPTLVHKNAKSYTLRIKLVGVKKFLGDKKTFLSFKPKEQGKLVLEMLRNCPAKLWSNDYSWYWQGTAENLAQLDGAMYPFVGVPGKGVWAARQDNNGFWLTKHFVEILQIINANYGDIAKMLRSTIQK